MVPGIPTDRTPPMALNDPALDGGNELLGAAATSPQTGMGPAVKAPVAKNIAQQSVSGRADDFSWPRKGSGTAAPEVPDATPTGSTGGSVAPAK